MNPTKTLWSGRFQESLSALALEFSASVDVDGRLFREDIAGSIAHAEMLGFVGIISTEESELLQNGLREILGEIERGEYIPTIEHEDIHTAIESRLTEKIGSIGGKLHTGRSRNDQVALDERLFLRNAMEVLSQKITEFQHVLLHQATAHESVILPGYTHVQRAQPILLAHHFCAYISMLERDKERFADCRRRVNRSPLGSAAFAGSPFPLDRERVATSLGFDGIAENSMDAVSDRDHLLEAISACAITMMHLSRFAEEMVLWSSKEFGFVTIGDAFTTGSSIMPHKKNPDMAELVRGKTGRVYGDLMNLLTTMKALPMAYNRDMQEDKFPLFDAIDTTSACLTICAGMLENTRFNVEKMAGELRNDFLTATEIADFLTEKGMPFRKAHEVTGKIVAYCVQHGKTLFELRENEWELLAEGGFYPNFFAEISNAIQPETSIQRKKSAGSTAPTEVRAQLERWKMRLAK